MPRSSSWPSPARATNRPPHAHDRRRGGRGAPCQGDLKLLVSVGLLGGPVRLFFGLVFGAIVAAIAIVVLVGLRRITLRSYVPYGPFLIAGAIWALLSVMET